MDGHGINFDAYHFVYNAAAYFNSTDKYPDGLITEISKPGAQGFAALCWALEELSTQGELVRRDMGYDKGPTLRAETARTLMMPPDIIKAREVIFRAVTHGLNNGKKGDEEVDEVLAEIQKKTVEVS